MLTADRLRELLVYDPGTGVFLRRGGCGGRKAGSVAGTRGTRYWQINIDGRQYLAHRLAFLYMTNDWPPHHVDHIDRNGFNNRFGNLRLATRSQNQGNRRVSRNNTTGIKGVTYRASRGLWLAQISVNGHQRHVGEFDTPEKAAAAAEHFGNFAKVVR
jgi:hypothetical protein